MKLITFITFISFILLGCNTRYKAVCKSVLDGDSFYLDNHKEVRIWGADCPEWTKGHNQPFGDVATRFTKKLIEGKEVTLIIKAHDKYHREVDKVILSNGSDLSLLLVQAGLAWTSERYSPQSYCNEEIKAKSKRVGLWIQSNPENPYWFRKREHKHSY